MPLYEYEHMLGFATVGRHVAEEITLLCDKHHKERTIGLLPISEVQRANALPFNRQQGVSKPYDLHYSGTECEVLIGGNRFTIQDTGYGTAIMAVIVDDIPLVGFMLTDGHLLLNVNIFDDSNNLILKIVNNELSYSDSPWDIDLVGRNLVIRESHRNLLLDIVFEVPNRVVIRRGRILCNGIEILIRPDHILLTNNNSLISGCEVNGVNLGLVIGQCSQIGSGFMAMNVTRYLGDPSESIRWARESMKAAPETRN
jgi:trigger factor